MCQSVNLSQAADLLRQAQDILILTHKSPDGDTIGSGGGLLRGLLAMGKRARLLNSDEIPARLARLLPEQEDFEPRYIVAVDVADTTLLGDKLAIWGDKVDLCIDHHPSNRRYAGHLLLEADSAATCEVILELLEELAVEITPEIADCLYTGIATDTGCFRYSNTTVRTHRMAAFLMEKGCDFGRINQENFETVSRARMALEREALETLEYHFGGKCAMITITRDMLEKNGARDDDTEGLSAIPRQIEGVQVGVTMKETKERDGFKLSLRTVEPIDACAACAQVGGGGHVRAAGCKITGTAENAREKILAALSQQFPDQQQEGLWTEF